MVTGKNSIEACLGAHTASTDDGILSILSGAYSKNTKMKRKATSDSLRLCEQSSEDVLCYSFVPSIV